MLLGYGYEQVRSWYFDPSWVTALEPGCFCGLMGIILDASISVCCIRILSKADGTIELDSGDERRIFTKLLFFEIRHSPPDFLDLEQSRKLTQWSPADRRRETSAAGRFSLEMTKFSADVLLVSRRYESRDHRPFTFWWPCSNRREPQSCALGSILKLIF